MPRTTDQYYRDATNYTVVKELAQRMMNYPESQPSELLDDSMVPDQDLLSYYRRNADSILEAWKTELDRDGLAKAVPKPSPFYMM